jgi:YVTN family beta-propeller protein
VITRVKFAICGGWAPTSAILRFRIAAGRCLVCGEHVDAWSEHPAFPQWAGVTMPDRHMPVSRRFDLSKGVPWAWPLAWVPHTSSGITAKRTVKVSWGQRVLSVVMVGATLVTGLVTLAVTPSAAAASAAPAPVTAYVTNSGSGLNSVDNSITPIDVATNTPRTAIPVVSQPQGVALSPDGTTLYVANSGGNTVTPIDAATNTPGTPITVGLEPGGSW